MIQWFEILEDTYDSHREGGTKNMNIVRIQYKGKISILYQTQITFTTIDRY